ncbi:hypothetical protein [Spirosoma luteum]|uniref:hypothetical protein n=1 Tax=Spirosoma luteum TaxID=431553 RepID=UPI00037679D3|nr:hypothetical protein [Spirosoma luteum]
MKVTIEVEDQRKLETLIEWLRENKFLDEITVNPTKSAITKGDKSIDPTALFGIWKDNPRTLEEIRKDAWRDGL